jgi:hypothetical protein
MCNERHDLPLWKVAAAKPAAGDFQKRVVSGVFFPNPTTAPQG